jgi:hypothetical protein
MNLALLVGFGLRIVPMHAGCELEVPFVSKC